jgi:phosphoenolpyruvate synthase/pyruvate phosphate dikinase
MREGAGVSVLNDYPEFAEWLVGEGINSISAAEVNLASASNQ